VRKNILYIIGLIILMVLVLQNSVFGLINSNDIYYAYRAEKRATIEEHMINGAALFFKGSSYVHLYLSEYEKSAGKDVLFNYVAANRYLEKAIDVLNQSLTEYTRAYDLGFNAGYDENIIKMMQDFNYDSISSNFNNQKIFSELAEYFKRGDILGIYARNIEYVKETIKLLELFNNETKKGLKTDVKSVWRLYQLSFESMCFGNYSTVIAEKIFSFNKITGF